MTLCMQCKSEEAVFTSPDGFHSICRDCSSANLDAHLAGPVAGRSVPRDSGESPSFYVHPPEGITDADGWDARPLKPACDQCGSDYYRSFHMDEKTLTVICDGCQRKSRDPGYQLDPIRLEGE